MAREIVEDPAPLNGYRQFPYQVSPFPFEWLRMFTTLEDTKDPEIAPNETLPTSLESWT